MEDMLTTSPVKTEKLKDGEAVGKVYISTNDMCAKPDASDVCEPANKRIRTSEDVWIEQSALRQVFCICELNTVIWKHT